MRTKPATARRNLARCPWRQVRVFIQDPRPGEGYANLLAYLVRPLARSLSATPFYFTRYGPLADGEDDADTKINELPESFRHEASGIKKHLSVRLRFAARKKAEDFIVQRLNAQRNLYWYSDVLDYDAIPGFAESRVFVGSDPTMKLVRAGLVAELLCTNARFILDTLVQNGSQWAFEANPQGGIFPTHFRFALHMMNNAYGFPNGAICPVGFPLQVPNPAFGFLPV